MIRILGCFCIILGCGYWGWAKGIALKNKVVTTANFINSLEFMKREITQHHRPLPQILEILGGKERGIVGGYFRSLEMLIEQEEQNPFAFGWAKSMAEFPELSPEVVGILEPLGNILGQFDAKSQGEALALVVEDLKKLKENEEVECRKMGQVYGTFGVTSGILLVILLL